MNSLSRHLESLTRIIVHNLPLQQAILPLRLTHEYLADTAGQRSIRSRHLPQPCSQITDLLWRILQLLIACATTKTEAKVRATQRSQPCFDPLGDFDISCYMKMNQSLVMDMDEDNHRLWIQDSQWNYFTRRKKLSIIRITADDYRHYFCTFCGG